jgi:hypothetical protein
MPCTGKSADFTHQILLKGLPAKNILFAQAERKLRIVFDQSFCGCRAATAVPLDNSLAG